MSAFTMADAVAFILVSLVVSYAVSILLFGEGDGE